MSSQPAALIRLAMKKRVDQSTPATGSGATEFAYSPSSGIAPNMALVQDDTIRQDGEAEGDGLGTRSGAGSYLMRVSPNKQDKLWPSLFRRDDWDTIPDITQTQITNATTATDGIIGNSGSFLALGVRRGWRVKASGLPDAANNGKWFDVVGVTASKISTGVGTLVANASPDTAFTLTFAKFLVAPASPVPQFWDIEEWRTLQLKGKNLLAAQLVKADIATGANAKVGATFNFMADDFEFNDSGTPRFSSPTKGSGRNVVTSDGLYRRNGADIKNIITDFGFSIDLSGESEALLGPISDTSTGLRRASGQFGVVAQDLQYMIDYYNKTNFELMFVAEDAGAHPRSGVSWYFGNCQAGSPTGGLTQNGKLKDQFQWSAGIDEGGGDRAATVVVMTSTAAL